MFLFRVSFQLSPGVGLVRTAGAQIFWIPMQGFHMILQAVRSSCSESAFLAGVPDTLVIDLLVHLQCFLRSCFELTILAWKINISVHFYHVFLQQTFL